MTDTLFATSADGTRIAYEARGTGPALVFVDGAMCQRAMGPSRPLAETLADRFTTICYDRRGRGESGAGASDYSVEREVEDLDAVIAAAGGHAHVFSASSGAALALRAARAGSAIDRLVAYEVPYILDDTHDPVAADLVDRVRAMVGSGDHGGAVKAFLRAVGAPAPMVAVMPLFPVWSKMKAVAHTLPYDLSFVAPFQRGETLPEGEYAGVATPTLVIAGGKSPAYMKNAQAAIVDQLPH
ncbi:MAG TPA: alpha/beta fold hydrolase, partial [Marmoricola sp.]